MDGVVREFLELARPVGDARPETDVGELAREGVELLEAEAEAEGVILEAPTAGASAQIDPEAVRRALINLVRNAIQASPAGGRVTVALQESRAEVALTVRDRGPGLAPEIEERAFEAFVTGRASGTGLGLALVRRVAEEHGGTIELVNQPRGGAQARLRLPRREC